MKMIGKILLFAKERPGLEQVIKYLSGYTDDIILFKGAGTDKFPLKSLDIFPDITISYISPWIIPGRVLNNTKRFSINFHPGPPEYPGIGCTNFAIYDGAKQYGVTAHLMDETVDTGRIIGVKKFGIRNDDVYSLTKKSYESLLMLFKEIIDFIAEKGCLPQCDEKWKRKPFTRRELEELCRIRQGMTCEEVKRRISAVTYPNMPGAYMELHGRKFEYNPDR